MKLVLAKKAVIIEGDGEIRSANYSVVAPKVIRLRYFVKVPYRARLPLTKRNVLTRDEGRCAYCRKTASTVDHVTPRSRGGEHRWENVVACCSPCNQEKGSRLLAELGWELPYTPKAPKGTYWLVMGLHVDPAWEPYLTPVRNPRLFVDEQLLLETPGIEAADRIKPNVEVCGVLGCEIDAG